MQHEKSKTSKLTMHSDLPTGGSFTRRGANFNSLGFNVSFIMRRRPALLIELARLFELAKNLKEEDALPPEEDYSLVEAELARLLGVVGESD